MLYNLLYQFHTQVTVLNVIQHHVPHCRSEHHRPGHQPAARALADSHAP
jgi:hypothetical protein